MSSSRWISTGALLLAITFSLPASAQDAPRDAHTHTLPADFQQRFPHAHIRRDAHQRATFISRIAQPRPEHLTSTRDHAVWFLDRFSKSLGIPRAQLSNPSSFTSWQREVVQFTQQVDGVPAPQGRLTMAFSREGELDYIVIDLLDLSSPILRGPITREVASVVAREASRGAKILSEREVIVSIGLDRRGLIAHEFITARVGDEIANALVRIDSRDGRVLSRTILATKN